MDYKRIKDENIAAVRREKKLTLLALLLVCIIVVQCIVIAVMWVSNYKYKVMYDEALETQLLMQKEINSLRSDSAMQENAEADETVIQAGEENSGE